MPCSLANFAHAASVASRRSVVSVISTGYVGSFGRGPVALGGGVVAQAFKLKAMRTQAAMRKAPNPRTRCLLLCAISYVHRKLNQRGQAQKSYRTRIYRIYAKRKGGKSMVVG